jgi:hypothetical protein
MWCAQLRSTAHAQQYALFLLNFYSLRDARDVVRTTALDCLGWRNRYDEAVTPAASHHQLLIPKNNAALGANR